MKRIILGFITLMFVVLPIFGDCPEVYNIDDPPCVSAQVPLECVMQGTAIITNAIFSTGAQAYAFANHHDTIAIISTSEVTPRYVVFFNSEPICLIPNIGFTIVYNSSTAFYIYDIRSELIKGIFNIDSAWYVWWVS